MTTNHFYDPATGQIVTEVIAADGTSTFYNPDGSVYAGDVNTLTTCPTQAELGGGDIVDNGDGTSTITVTTTDGTQTTGTVINSLLKNSGAYGTSAPLDPDADIILTEAQVSDPALFPGDINTEAALVYKRADGKMVVLANPAAPVDVDSVLSNGDGTVTITTTDDAGTVTTAVVLETLLVNDGAIGTSRAVDPDADILLHDGNVDALPATQVDTAPVYKDANGKLVTAVPPIQDRLLDPATGQVVVVTYDGAGGATYTLLDGTTAWAGDPLTLTCLTTN